jgi:hypothetical protein
MATIWLTYAWEDNDSGDVNFAAQELQQCGLTVKLDRWNISAGRRLWEQIDGFISKPEQSDGWLLYATQASLLSEKCKEEFSYALHRALDARGDSFPVIALFPGPFESTLIPTAIKVRLHVRLTDPDWKERVKAAVEGRPPGIGVPELAPYYVKVHQSTDGGAQYVIEVRPRAGTWSPFLAAIHLGEKDVVKPSIQCGPRDRIPGGGILVMHKEGESKDRLWWVLSAQNEATPTQSYFVFCQQLPSVLVFGVDGGPLQYQWTCREAM